MLMTAAMVGLITWATRPDLMENQYNRIAAPVVNHFADQRAAAWQAAKEHAWKQWMGHVHIPGDCAKPATSLRNLECKNQIQQQANIFENDWANKIANGWKPEGVN
jgi:hypothetical protein